MQDDSKKYISMESSVIVPSSACGAQGHDRLYNSHPSKTIRVDYLVLIDIQGNGSPRVSYVPPQKAVLLGCTPRFGTRITNTQYDYSIDNTLINAVKSRNQSEVTKALNSGANPNAVENGRFYSSALILAANNGDMGIVRILLDAGAQINFQDDIGQSAIYVAVDCGSNNKSLVEYLANKGADVNSKIKSNYQDGKFTNWTPLKFASYLNHTEIVKYLKSKGAVQYVP